MPDSDTADRLSSALDASTAEALSRLDEAAIGESLAALRRQIRQLESQRLRSRLLTRQGEEDGVSSKG